MPPFLPPVLPSFTFLLWRLVGNRDGWGGSGGGGGRGGHGGGGDSSGGGSEGESGCGLK